MSEVGKVLRTQINTEEHFPEDSSAPKILTLSKKQQNTSMEVHKNPHNVMQKKKWMEYVLEFMMIFFAVFLGFLAENKREHFADQQKALQYARSLKKDLEIDARVLGSIKVYATVLADASDSLWQLLHRKDLSSLKGNRLYYYGRQLPNNILFVSADATIKQLLGSGTLRYFETSPIAEDISRYSKLIQITDNMNWTPDRFQLASDLQATFFDIDQIELIKIRKADWSFENDSLIVIRAGLLQHNKYQLQRLKQFLRFKRNEYQRISDLYDSTLQQAKKLLAELKIEYNL